MKAGKVGKKEEKCLKTLFKDVGNYLKLDGQVAMWGAQSAPFGSDRVN